MNFTTRSIDLTTPTTATAVQTNDHSVNSYFTPEKGVPLKYDEDALDCNSENDDDDDEMDMLMREGMNAQRDMDDDLQQIKARLMRLVSKGQKEAELEEENRKKRNGQRDQAQADYDKALSKAKEDAEMLEKSFLQEAQSTINTQLERPQVGKINSKEDEMIFMCIDIDFYIDKPPRKTNLFLIVCRIPKKS